MTRTTTYLMNTVRIVKPVNDDDDDRWSVPNKRLRHLGLTWENIKTKRVTNNSIDEIR